MGLARIRGVNPFEGLPRGGSGGKAPSGQRIFKKFLKKIAKMHYLSIFFKKFNNHALIFRPFGRKTQIVGKILKIFDENAIQKLNILLFL